MQGYEAYDKKTEVSIGTPVEIPEEEVRKKAVPIQDQVVKDDRGRRRFHGAFTGGFSAGYFNSVGSVEGWTPKTFTSSRSKRDAGNGGKAGDKYQQSIEDFMDEEDKSEVGFAPKRVTATDQFEISEKKDEAVVESGALSGAVLSDMVVAAKRDMGTNLMKLMGWREGQGVGPREHASAKRLRDGGSSAHDLESDLFLAAGKTFAPQDISIDQFGPKDNLHGIGYRGMAAADFNLGNSERKQQSRRGGIGVGALEDEDADIYDDEDIDLYDRVAGPSEMSDGPRHLFRPRSARQHSKSIRNERIPVTLDEDTPLRGFVLATSKLSSIKIYPAPKVPRGFNPFHEFKTAGPAFENHRKAGTTKDGRPINLTAQERMKILGEEALPGAKKSVFDYLKPEDKARLLGTNTIPPHQGSDHPPGPPAKPPPGWQPPPRQSPPPPPPSQRKIQPPRPPPGMNSKSAMMPGVFRPFEKDPLKEQRYLAYLDGKAVDYSHMYLQEQIAELEAFVKAATLYQPLKGAMASRFTSASGLPPKTAESGGGTSAKTVVSKDDARDNAVKMKLFGKLTRDYFEWHPSSLLCKRFDVPDPFPKSGVLGVVVGAKAASLDGFSKMGGTKDGPIKVNELWSESIVEQLEPIELEEDITTGSVAPKNENASVKADSNPAESARPPMDIFKAIFSDSSSDEDEDNSDMGQATDNDITKTVKESPNIPTRGPGLPAEAPILPAPRDPTLKYSRKSKWDGEEKSKEVGTSSESLKSKKFGSDTSDAPSSRITDLLTSRAAAPLKLSLVNTYDNLTVSNEVVQKSSEVLRREKDTNTASMWVEKPSAVPKKSHKDKKSKKSKKKSKKKDKKMHRSKSKSSKTGDYDGDSESPDSEEESNRHLPSDAALLKKIREARDSGQGHLIPVGPTKPPSKFPEKKVTQTNVKKKKTEHHQQIPPAWTSGARKKRPTAADFM